MDKKKLKEMFKSTFDTVADGYDHSAMSFFPESAEQICTLLELTGDEQILDIATGTGYVAMKAAKLLPQGKVIGIDFSSGMLAKAMEKKKQQNATNVTFLEMDMQALQFPDTSFDVAISSFGIFFIEDMVGQLREIMATVKTGGKIIITTFYESSFSPLVELLFLRLKEYGIEPPSLAWKRVATRHHCLKLFRDAGIDNVSCNHMDCGYYLRDAADWWYIVWNGGFRGLVNQLDDEQLIRFQQDHLEEVQACASEQGIRVEMGILYTMGRKGEQ